MTTNPPNPQALVGLDLPAPPLPSLLPAVALRGALIAILLLNMFDAYYSVLFIHNAAVLVEANPLMAVFLSFGLGGVPFVMAKTALVTTGCMVLWRRPRLPVVQGGAYCCLVAYFATVTHFYLFSLASVA